MGHLQVLLHQVRVDLGVMVLKVYSILLLAPELSTSDVGKCHALDIFF